MTRFLLLKPQPKVIKTLDVMQQAGLTVVAEPLQQIVEDSSQFSVFVQQLTSLPQKSCVIFTSTFAAEYAIKAMQGNIWPQQLNYFAVGSSTADCLQNTDIKVRLPKRFDSEGLLEMAELIDVSQRQVLIVKGQNGRQTLQQELTERGATVQLAELYKRENLSPAADDKSWQKQQINCIIATSGEQVEQAFSIWPASWLTAVSWICISQRIADMLSQHGVKKITVSDNATDEAVIKCAVEFEEQQMSQDTDQDKLKELESQVKQSQAAASESKVAPESEVKPEPAPKINKPQSQSIPQGNKGTSAWLKLLVLINFIAVIALAAGAYWWWSQQQARQQQQQDQFSQQQRELMQSIELARQQMLNKQDAQNSELTQQVEQLVQQSAANTQHLNQMSGQRPSDWVIAEADYLVKMAGRKLWLEHDTDTAIAMLKAADVRLAELDDPSLLPVRANINDDIQTLQLINPVPFDSLVLNLSSLRNRAEALPVAMVALPKAEDAAQQSELSDSVDDWQANLSRSWEKFKQNFITIKPRVDKVQPLMNAQEQWLVKQQFKHYLQQAEWALQQEKADYFVQSVQAALVNLQQYFDFSSAAVRQVEQQLLELSKTDIHRQYPQQLSAAQPLRELTQQRLSGAIKQEQAL
ncbi:uroporphyrinogen-III C-methyltransferase [Neptunicella marina]|uniref:Uroporphyrinogen-III synthase n=1 Tax=Neptunicella marina TaxID=2125989 RepID=A0A8J6IV60_9ALTE|nr:uroporphyrinogen-III C-methyltransferase [Neptunicella marina]MBC3766487.1 uroporphyrinogen-III synthase [Neptunicella marina]